MNPRIWVKQVRFYTRSNDPINRQIVAVMSNGRKYRFSEDKMKRELQERPLPEPLMRTIEYKARRMAEAFLPPDEDLLIADSTLCDEELPAADSVPHEETVEERDLRIAQNLHSEFQDVLKSLYG